MMISMIATESPGRSREMSGGRTILKENYISSTTLFVFAILFTYVHILNFRNAAMMATDLEPYVWSQYTI